MRAFTQFPIILGRVCFSLFAKLEIEGRENIPPKGPLLVVCNHLSYLDPAILMIIFNRPLFGLAKKELFANVISRWFFRTMGCFPVNRNGKDSGALRWAIKGLSQGRLNNALIQDTSDSIMTRIARLLPISYRGSYDI